MALTGKGFMIWKVERCESGNADAIADAARQAGLTHVVIKIAQGVLPANIDKLSRVDRVPPIVQALRKNGIQVLGWHNIFGHDPIREAHLAVQRTQQLELDGYVFDAGYEYKSPGMASAAHAFMTELRKGILNKPVGLSSYRSPKYHHTLPWKEFLEKCDFTMPQVYWEMAHNPADQLTKCVLQFQELPVQRPIIPTGPVYRGRNNWSASPGEITEFLIQARALGIKAVNFFEWHYGRTLLKPIWNAIAAFPWPPYPTPPAVKDVPQQYIEILNTRDPDLLSYMYTRDAVHITTSKTLQGVRAIRNHYANFLSQMQPDAFFELTSTTKTETSRTFSWKASAPAGTVIIGNDTFGLINGKIAYHYSNTTAT